MNRLRRTFVAMALTASGAAAAPAIGAAAAVSVCPAGPPACDFATLTNDALLAAGPGGSVDISPGVYAISSQVQFFENVTVRGAGPDRTIIDGAGVIVEPEATAARLSGVTLRGATGPEVINVGGLTLTNSVLKNGAIDRISGEPGGILNNGSLVVRDTTITGIGHDVGGVRNLATMVLDRSTVRDSIGAVGGVINTGRLTLLASDIVANGGLAVGGIRNDAGAHLTARGGRINRNTGQGIGGLQNDGTALLRDTAFARNSTGIANSGSLTLRHVSIGGWSSGYNSNAGLTNDGSAVIQDSTIDGSDADAGNPGQNPRAPAVTNQTSGRMTITGSTIRHAPEGGIDNFGSLTLRSSIVTRNTSFSNGAGIHNVGSLMLRDSAVTRNRSLLAGGGIWNSGSARVVDSRIANNTAVNGGGIANVAPGFVQLIRTAIAANSPDGCSGC